MWTRVNATEHVVGQGDAPAGSSSPSRSVQSPCRSGRRLGWNPGSPTPRTRRRRRVAVSRSSAKRALPTRLRRRPSRGARGGLCPPLRRPSPCEWPCAVRSGWAVRRPPWPASRPDAAARSGAVIPAAHTTVRLEILVPSLSSTLLGSDLLNPRLDAGGSCADDDDVERTPVDQRRVVIGVLEHLEEPVAESRSVGDRVQRERVFLRAGGVDEDRFEPAARTR